MAKTPSSAPKTPSASERVAAAWILSAGLGAGVAGVLASRHIFPDAPVLATIAAIAAGWAAAIVFAPWRLMLSIGRDRRAISRLARDVRRISSVDRDRSLQNLILDREDELGELSCAIHDTVVRTLAAQRESQRLQRTMDDTIRRETDRATHRLQREATTDPLTGVGNRRTLERRLEELFRPDRRRRSDTVVAMLIDIDRFKEINDRLGHEVGDQCLSFIGDLLASTLRREDCAARIGGDEFVVLMPNQAVAKAQELAVRLADLFAQMPWRHRAAQRPTLSIGIASAPCSEPDGGQELLRRADAALYEVKRAGRNGVRTEHGAPRPAKTA